MGGRLSITGVLARSRVNTIIDSILQIAQWRLIVVLVAGIIYNFRTV
jgi:hypothetical protein